MNKGDRSEYHGKTVNIMRGKKKNNKSSSNNPYCKLASGSEELPLYPQVEKPQKSVYSDFLPCRRGQRKEYYSLLPRSAGKFSVCIRSCQGNFPKFRCCKGYFVPREDILCRNISRCSGVARYCYRNNLYAMKRIAYASVEIYF